MGRSVLTNRELASLILFVALIVFVLTRPGRDEVLESVRGVLKSFRERSILVPFLLYVGWIGVSVAVASRWGLWDPSLLKTTILWLLLSGFGLVMSLNEAIRRPRFFRRAIIKTLGIAVVVEFVAALESFSLWVEIPTQGLAVVFAMVGVVAGQDSQYESARKLAKGYLVLYALTALLWGVIHLIRDWAGLEHAAILREFLLPMWLTPAALLFVYVFAVVAAYQSAFLRMGFWNEDGPLWRQKLAMVLRANLRLRYLRLLAEQGENRVARAAGFLQAWKEVGAPQRAVRGGELEPKVKPEGFGFEDTAVPGIFALFTTSIRLASELDATLSNAAAALSRTKDEVEALHDRLKVSGEAFEWLGSLETAYLIRFLAQRGRRLDEIEMMAPPIAVLLAIFQPQSFVEPAAKFDRLLTLAGEPSSRAMRVADTLTAEAKREGMTLNEVVDAQLAFHEP